MLEYASAAAGCRRPSLYLAAMARSSSSDSVTLRDSLWPRTTRSASYEALRWPVHDGDQPGHGNFDHVDGQQAVSDVAHCSADGAVDLIDKGGALAYVAVPGLDEVALDEADEDIDAVGDDEARGVHGLHHVRGALGQGGPLSGPPARRQEGDVGRAIVGRAAVPQRLRPGGGEQQPCLERDGCDDAGDKGVGQEAEPRLPVGQVAPGDEDGDGGEDYISALQGHRRGRGSGMVRSRTEKERSRGATALRCVVSVHPAPDAACLLAAKARATS